MSSSTSFLTRITLHEDGTEPPLVERIFAENIEAVSSGEIVLSKRIRSSELHRRLILSADNWMIFESVFSDLDGDKVNTLFEYLESDHFTEEQRKTVIDALVEGIVAYDNEDTLRELFISLCQRVDVSALAMDSLNALLAGVISRVENVSDPHQLLSLLYTLLGRLHYFDSPDKETISTVLEAAVDYTKEMESGTDVDLVWSHLSKRVSKRMILEAAEPHLDDLELVTPLLPKNTAFYKKSTKQETIAIFVEPNRFDVNLGDSLYEAVGHPGLLFWFNRNKTSDRGDGHWNAHVAAVKDTTILADTKLYAYPFSNVYDSFACCWSVPSVRDLHQMSTLPYLFLTGIRNFHLYKGAMNYRELLTSLSQKDFDLTLLCDTGKRVRDIY